MVLKGSCFQRVSRVWEAETWFVYVYFHILKYPSAPCFSSPALFSMFSSVWAFSGSFLSFSVSIRKSMCRSVIRESVLRAIFCRVSTVLFSLSFILAVLLPASWPKTHIPSFKSSNVLFSFVIFVTYICASLTCLLQWHLLVIENVKM